MASSNVSWGIDIGAGAVKAIRLERDGDDVRVDDFVVVQHKRVLSTPDIVEADAIRVALGSFLGEYREQLRGASVVCSLPGHGTFARFAKLPPVEAKGVENLVKFEAVQQIPFPIEDVEWDYQVFASEDTPEVEVGIFAVTRERVNEKLSLWGEVGLSPDEITLGPVAAYNAIAYDLQFTENSPGTVIVDIGTVATDLIIAERGRVWIRTFPIGGHHFTEVLAETFKLDYRKAEKLKQEAETSKYKRHIFQALKPILTDLVQDVQRSISYYTETHPSAKLERVIGLGSTFKLLGLRKLMSQQLGIDVFRLEGFKRTRVEGSAAVEFDSVSINMATAYGLALQGLGLTPIDANLIPATITRDALWRSKTPYFVAASVIGLVGAASTFLQPLMNSGQSTDFESDPRVRDVISQSNTLRSSWEEIEAANQLEFLPSNADALLAGDPKVMHLRMLADANAMLAQATGTGDDRLYRMFSFQTDYLAPGTALVAGASSPSSGASAPSPGGRGRNPFGGGGGGRDEFAGGGPAQGDTGDGGAPAATDDSAAGPRGAFRVTLELDSTRGDLPTFNDEVLEWLRDESHMYGNEYKIVGVPRVDGVPLNAQITPQSRGDNQLTGGDEGARDGAGGGGTGRGGVTSGPGGRSPGGVLPGGRNPGGAGSAGRGQPMPSDRGGDRTGAPSGSGVGGSQDTTIEGMAPIEIPPGPFEGAQNLYRYTLTYYVQRLDAPFEAPADDAIDPDADPNDPDA